MSIVHNLFGEEEHTLAPPSEFSSALTETMRLGRMAEFLVCVELTRLGYFVTHVDAPGFDLVLCVNDASFRVQVKSSTQIRNGRCRWVLHVGRYINGVDQKRAITRASADLLALYHHEFSTIVFVPVEGRSTAEFTIAQVKSHVASESLAIALRQLGVTEI